MAWAPRRRVSPHARGAGGAAEADAIVIGPGSLFTNLIPLLLIKEINESHPPEQRAQDLCLQPDDAAQPDRGLFGGRPCARDAKALRLSAGLCAGPPRRHISPEVLERYRSTSADLVAPQLVANDDSQVAIFPDTPQEMVLIEGAILMQRDLATEVLRAGSRHRPGAPGGAPRSRPSWARRCARCCTTMPCKKQLSVSRAIFREYDIRGIVGAELNSHRAGDPWGAPLAPTSSAAPGAGRSSGARRAPQLGPLCRGGHHAA